jgi:tetratricopeptide (TPR) repeat protein
MSDITITEIKDTRPTLCLNMIVKNESKIIKRLFDSVASIIDSYCICDTGSTDDTVQIIREYFEKKNIPGLIVQEPFKNFCHNRNFALNSALGLSDYILLMDADMTLEVINFTKQELTVADSFNILQGNNSFHYQNMRIVRNNGLYSYCGVTHEYINVPSTNIMRSFTKTQLFIRDIGDGGSKSDKFERDIKLLTDGIIDEPDNVRYHFYLANSYFDHGDFKEAIEIYKKRIKLGGWNQEVWYSYYRIGLCYKNTGDITNAICTWMEGYDYLPDRLEGLCEIITHYRVISKHKLALLFYSLAVAVLQKNHNTDGYLFLYKDIYTFKIYYEYTIIASWLGIRNINDELIVYLNNCNDSTIQNTFNNMKFYKDVLKPITVINLDSKINVLINGENTLLTSSSSCMIQHENKKDYILNVRYVNYHITEHGSYLNCDNHIITVNKCVNLDNECTFIKEKWFDVNFVNRRYIGVEDVKIFHDTVINKTLFIGTGFHNNNKIGIVSGKYDVTENSLVANELTTDFSNSDCEKNWVFVTFKNETHIIYKWNPLQICKLDESSNQIKLVETKPLPRIFNHVRGSSCGFTYIKTIQTTIENYALELNVGEIWFVVHLVSYEQPRHYYHMIVVFDTNMQLLRYSAPFKFDTEPIEYCLSLIVEDDRVLMNYSTWDRTTRIGIYDKKYIDSITKYKA